MGESQYVSLRDLLKKHPCPKQNLFRYSRFPKLGGESSSKTLINKSSSHLDHVTEMFNHLKFNDHPFVPPSSSLFYSSDSSPEHEMIEKIESKKNCSSANESDDEKKNAACSYLHRDVKILPNGEMYVLRENGRPKLNIAYTVPEAVHKEMEEEEAEAEAAIVEDEAVATVEDEAEKEDMAVDMAAAAAEKVVEGGEELAVNN